MLKKELNSRLVGEILKALRKHHINPEAVILHGSYAKGTYIEELSDLDILIISENFRHLDMPKRFSLLANIFKGFKPHIEAIGYTRQEILEQMEKLNPLILDALEYGKPLHGRELFEQLKSIFEQLKKQLNLKPIKHGWIYKSPQKTMDLR